MDWAAQGCQKQAGGIGYARQNDDQPKGARGEEAKGEVYRGRIVGLILAVLSLGAVGVFAYATLYASRQLPVAAGAPAVGDKAPEFALADTSGRMVTLSMLLSEPMPGIRAGNPRGVLLVFYRGYW